MLLEARDLTIKFGGLTAVNKFSLNLEKNEIVGLIGPNGAGKTTTFNMMTGVYKPTSGSLTFADTDISNKKGGKIYRPDQIAKMGIARTFQNIRLFSSLSALDNVCIAQHLNLKSSFLGAVLRSPSYRKEDKVIVDKAHELLNTVGLADIAQEEAGSLPYGQQRRLEIARALATDPKLLLLDEPAAGMNPQEGQELVGFIADIKEKFDLTILMIEHDMKVVMGICERIMVLDYGQCIAEGTPHEIQTNEQVIEAYLGVDADA